MNRQDWQVVVAGGGPAGLAAAFLLARAGIPVLVVERRAVLSAHPRARGLNVRTMELFRSWGLHHRLAAAAGPTADYSLRIWAEQLAGPELRRDRAGQGDGLGVASGAAVSPAAPCLCPQYGVEAVLREAAEAAGATLRLGHAIVGIEWHGGEGTAVVSDLGRGDAYRVPARYVLAADGARGMVRRFLGIGCTGPGLLARNLSIHFRADLSAHLAGRDLIWCRVDNDRVSGLLMPVTRDEWLLVVSDPGGDCRSEDLVSAAVGAAADVAVLGVQRYDVMACVADRIRAGNVFLLGDAAHQFPPAGAFGMNAGIHDAHNLAWKIAAVLAGWAGPGLLDSYQAERRPVAVELMSRAVRYLGLLGLSGGAGARPDPLGRPAWDMAAALGAVYRSAACGIDDPVGPAISDELTTVQFGARAPHLPLRGGGSVLDLFGDGYVLLGGPGADPAWGGAAEAVRSRCGLPVRACLTRLSQLDGVTWADRYGGDQRVVLVRPDGHVAWVCAASADPGALRAVLTRQTASEGRDHGRGLQSGLQI